MTWLPGSTLGPGYWKGPYGGPQKETPVDGKAEHNVRTVLGPD